MTIPQIRDVGGSGKIRMLIYGDPGVGKTTLIGTGGKEFKTLLIRPPMDHPDNIIGSGVKEIVVRSWDDMNEALEYLRHEGTDWDWVWLDSISLFQDTGLSDLFSDAVSRNEHRAEFGPDKPEYRVNMWRLEEWVRHSVGAEMFNLGITAHPFWMTLPTDESPESAREQLMPWIQGKSMPQKISGYMNIVGYMDVFKPKDKNEVHRIRTRKSQQIYAKDQFNAFGPRGTILNPTMPKIVAAINDTRPRPRRKTRSAPQRTRRTRRER